MEDKQQEFEFKVKIKMLEGEEIDNGNDVDRFLQDVSDAITSYVDGVDEVEVSGFELEEKKEGE